MLVFLVIGLFSLFFLIHEVLYPQINRYATAFWLFILREVAVFGTLFATVLWKDEG